MNLGHAFQTRGWVLFDFDPDIARWAKAAYPAALKSIDDPELAQWHQCEGTWFIGVDALPNDGAGKIRGGPPLSGAAVDFIRKHYGEVPALHRAQVSVIYPGYPRPRDGENEAAFRYRRDRFAAHVDGIKLVAGEVGRRRHLDEPHAWVLGLPLNIANAAAAPMVIWEGSHQIMREAFHVALQGHAPESWFTVDITDAYTAARKRVFETCKCVTVSAKPGEAYLIHRLALHGVAPWGADAQVPDGAGRMIAYFRPEVMGDLAQWLDMS
ncbi:MAG: hypothetical protein ACU0BB_01255 [Paracoccaceae bacterium]